MDLAHINGFPLWEHAVYDALHAAFEPLQARLPRKPEP
jgi:hypothetical protein